MLKVGGLYVQEFSIRLYHKSDSVETVRDFDPIPVIPFSLSPFREQAEPDNKRSMSNPFGIPDTSSTDFDYSKLSPMLGMIDNDAPDYIGGSGVQRKWNERTMHNCALLYLGGFLSPLLVIL